MRTGALLVLVAAAVGAYLAGEGLGLPHRATVFVAFLVLPIAVMVAVGEPLRLGRLDRGLAAGLLANLAAFAFRLPHAVSSPDSFVHLARGFFGEDPVLFALLVSAGVMPVDLFIRRVLQLEAETRFGAAVGIAVAVLAWMVGHVREYRAYLAPQVGAVEAAVYLLLTGIVGAALYARSKNVLGFMAGHLLLNVLLGATAWALR